MARPAEPAAAPAAAAARAGPTPEQVTAIKAAIAAASTLEEVCLLVGCGGVAGGAAAFCPCSSGFCLRPVSAHVLPALLSRTPQSHQPLPSPLSPLFPTTGAAAGGGAQDGPPAQRNHGGRRGGQRRSSDGRGLRHLSLPSARPPFAGRTAGPPATAAAAVMHSRSCHRLRSVCTAGACAAALLTTCASCLCLGQAALTHCFSLPPWMLCFSPHLTLSLAIPSPFQIGAHPRSVSCATAGCRAQVAVPADLQRDASKITHVLGR